MKARIGNVSMPPLTLLVAGPFILMFWLMLLPFKLLAQWQDRRQQGQANDQGPATAGRAHRPRSRAVAKDRAWARAYSGGDPAAAGCFRARAATPTQPLGRYQDEKSWRGGGGVQPLDNSCNHAAETECNLIDP